MSIFLCRAVVTRAQLERPTPKTEMQIEQDFIDAKVNELARIARRQRIASLVTPVTSACARLLDRLARPSREAQQRKDLRERLESMPAYMLSDIGVVRDSVGRYCFHDDFGRLVEVAPDTMKPAVADQHRNNAAAEGHLAPIAAE